MVPSDDFLLDSLVDQLSALAGFMKAPVRNTERPSSVAYSIGWAILFLILISSGQSG